MVKSFLFWITLQLVFIAWGTVSIESQINMRTYVCPKPRQYGPDDYLTACIFPIAVFIPANKAVEKYCEEPK